MVLKLARAVVGAYHLSLAVPVHKHWFLVLWRCAARADMDEQQQQQQRACASG